MYIKIFLVSVGLIGANVSLANADLDVVESHEDFMDLEEYYDMMGENFEIRSVQPGGFNSLYGFGNSGLYNPAGRGLRYPTQYSGAGNYNSLFRGGALNNRVLNYGSVPRGRPFYFRQNKNYGINNIFGTTFGRQDKKYTLPRARFNYNHRWNNPRYNKYNNIPWFPQQGVNMTGQTIYR